MHLKKTTPATVAFPFLDNNGAILPNKILSASLSLDGAPFIAATNTVTEIGNGDYALSLTAEELNANIIALYATDGVISTKLYISTYAEPADTETVGSIYEAVTLIRQILANKTTDNGVTITVYDDDNITPLGSFSWTQETGTRGKLT